MKFILAIAMLFFTQSLTSQVKPDFFPEDISHDGLGVRCFCKPGTRDKSRSKGLVLSYTLLGKGVFEDEDNSVTAPYTEYSSWKRFEVGMKIPIINKERFKALIGFKYESESFNIDRFGSDFEVTFREVDASNLKKNGVSLLFTHPLSETKYLAMRLGYSANGNYEGLLDFNKDYAVYKSLLILGVKPTEDFEWGIGLSYSSSFRKTSTFPFLIYNRNFNRKWGVESVFPANVYLRYNFKPSTIFLMGVAYNSDSYRLIVITPVDDRFDYGLNHSEIMGVLRLEQQIAPWVWASAKLGYQTNFSTDFEVNDLSTTPFKVEPTSGLFFQLGLFLSPPDGFMSK